MRSLSSFQRQRHQLAVFISRLEDDLRRLQDTARIVELHINETRSALQQAEAAWRKASHRMMLYTSYNAGIAPSEILNANVYQRLTSSLRSYRAQMLLLQDSLAQQMDLLEDVSVTQQKVLQAKERERSTLSATITQSKKELQQLRSNKGTLLAELRKKEQSARRVRSLISALVAKENEQREKAAERRAKSGPSRSEAGEQREGPRGQGAPQIGEFKRKSLPWPTPTTAILQGFGTYKNPATGAVFENPGIDIKASTGTRVVAVAPGKVSSVTWLPGYGSLVIIDHENGFRTVYANLETVSVSQGRAVSAGASLGTSGENIDGMLVHFEIWYGREKQNPLIYLR